MKVLPITLKKTEILNSVTDADVTIITAETGSGKSTQVCQYLYATGYTVIITEPRKIAAVSLANRVNEEMNLDIPVAAYHTALDSNIDENSRIIFSTGGLRSIRRMVYEASKTNPTVLVIDEAHEWTLNTETIVAWVKHNIDEGTPIKTVIMSATLDTESLQEYFGVRKEGFLFSRKSINIANVIEVPGTLYPVERLYRREYYFIDTIVEYIYEQKNILVFVSGKKDIDETIELISRRIHSDSAMIIPLHGELTLEEQLKCFKHYNIPKVVVSTNVAQTSISIADIDVVVDSGFEKIEKYDDGVGGIFFNEISQADCIQRCGRAGRTKDGIYILCSDTEFEHRREFPIPEIQRLVLDQVVLRLASIDIDATELEFFHQPKRQAIIEAKKSLELLGALKDGEVTEVGKKIAKMPVSVKSGKMILDADAAGVVDDILTITAIMEIGSLVNHKKSSYMELTDVDSSDILAELDIWDMISKKQFANLKQAGINSKNFFRIRELIELLVDSLDGMVTFGSTGDKESILNVYLSNSLERLHTLVNEYNSEYQDVFGSSRNLDRKTCVDTYPTPKLIIGNPRTIEFKDKYGSLRTLDIVTMVTAITIEKLEELAPGRIVIAIDDSSIYYEHYGDYCVIKEIVKFDNFVLWSKEIKTKTHPKYEELKQEWIREEEKRQEELREWRESLGLSYGLSIHSLYPSRAPEPERQTYVEVDGIKLQVRHDWRDTYVVISSDELFRIKSNSVKLDNGTSPMIRCERFKANNFVALREKIKHEAIKEKVNLLKDRIPRTCVTRADGLIPLFNYIGREDISFRFSNDILTYYICLIAENGSVHLTLESDEKKANASTVDAIKFIFKKELTNLYSEKKFQIKVNGKNIMTKKLEKAKKDFDDFADDLFGELTVNNFSESLELLSEMYSELTEGLLEVK